MRLRRASLANSDEPLVLVVEFARWWLVTDCELYDHCAGADLTRDGMVNLEDLAIIAAQWLL